MKAKMALLISLALVLALLIAFVVFGETIIALLNPVRNDWIEEDGLHYYIDENGDRLTGWQTLNGIRYYLDPAKNGARQTGWLELDGRKYFFDANGIPLTGRTEVEGNTYFFSDEGAATGWLEQDGEKYYLNGEGILQTGWLELDGSKFYLDEQGAMVTGWQTIHGGSYFFADDGILQTGWLVTEEGTSFYFNADGTMATGWINDGENQYFLNEDGTLYTGWAELDGKQVYVTENGVASAGWVETETGRRYINEDGTMHTGWLEADGQKYYLKEDGTAAVGKQVIDGVSWYFTSTGEQIYLVNRWNEVPADYTVELVTLDNGKKIAAECYDALVQMVADCTAYGCHPQVIGANRTQGDQQSLFNNKIAAFQEQGYSYGAAYAATMEAVAVPGTSEHQLGLAVDILDKYYPKSYSGDDNCLVWLNEHCWEYGFIIRYPEDKKRITGIKFEPWHYRYVGVELAMELKDSGLCLEEYLDGLTNDGTTCGNPDA